MFLYKLQSNISINRHILFYLIKYKIIPILGFNFDISDIIGNNDKRTIITHYILGIIKKYIFYNKNYYN